MRTLQSIMRTDYVLLEAAWTSEFALKLLALTPYPAVVVHRLHKKEEYYYVFPMQEVVARLQGRNPLEPLEYALNLHEYTSDKQEDQAAPTAAMNQPAAVMMNEGRVTGYAHYNLPKSGPERVGGLPALLRRALKADFPANLALGAVADLRVQLLKGRLRAGGGELPVNLPAGEKLDVVVQVRRGLEPQSTPTGQIIIGSPNEYAPLRFPLKAVEEGTGDVRVIVFHDDAALGYLTLNPILTGPATPAGPGGGQRVATTQNIAAVQVATPDLSLHIEEVQQNNQRGFVIYLTAADTGLGLNLEKYGPVYFQSDPGPYFAGLFRSIEGLPNASQQEQERAARELEGLGVYLFENLLPQPVQTLLWSLQNKVRSIFLQSSEPWVPWELCRLTGDQGGKRVEGPFLCEAFDVTRWLPGTGLKPALRLNNVAVVAPDSSNLPYTVPETDFLLKLSGGARKFNRLPARYLELYKALCDGAYDGWHFSGHGAVRGSDPNKAEMLLDQQETLTPYRISGAAANLGRSVPLVFLNACQIGAGGMALTDIGGWARQFLEAGAGAFIGAQWAIMDRTAFFFTKELYPRLLKGQNVAEAVRESRLAVRAAGDSTWLAYTVFAHPLAKIA